MSMKIVSITVLLFSACLLFQASAQNRRHVGRRIPPCCTKVSAANICSEVTENTCKNQTAKHHCVEAIILTTRDGPACVDPKAEWVKQFTANMTCTL